MVSAKERFAAALAESSKGTVKFGRSFQEISKDAGVPPTSVLATKTPRPPPEEPDPPLDVNIVAEGCATEVILDPPDWDTPLAGIGVTRRDLRRDHTKLEWMRIYAYQDKCLAEIKREGPAKLGKRRDKRAKVRTEGNDE